MNILGISAFYHDSAACLVQNGQIFAAAQEERFTRLKHDQSFPHHAIDYCLKEAHINTNQLDYIAFYDKPLLKFDRLLETYLAYAPQGVKSWLKAMPIWLKQKLWIKELIRRELNFKGTILFPEHHLSHAASAFYPSPFKKAAFLTIDGVGEWTTTSYGVGQHNKLNILADLHFPHSLGLLYSAFTYYCGFKVNSGEYKLMGLAPYGRPHYTQLILDELLDLKSDGSFQLNLKYFNYPVGLTMTNSRFHKLFGGPPRQPEQIITQRHLDIARSIQAVTENIVLKMAHHVHQQTHQPNLCLAGGVALNCVANGRLLREGPFDDIWIQPAAGDAGGAIGAALATWYQYLKQPRSADNITDKMSGAYLGPSFSNKQIKSFLLARAIPFSELPKKEVAGQTANLIAQGNVVGFFQGKMEFGPRALGARSILGDARSPTMQKIMNEKIKFRESFRPFAPAILAEKTSDFFAINKPSPYMLLVAPVTERQHRPLHDTDRQLTGLSQLQITRSSIPAVTHVDYSARVQTVDGRHHLLFWQVLQELDRLHTCPVVINTSFNVRGEPIVCTPEDAYRCFSRTNMDYLVMGNFLISKNQ